MYTIMAGKMVQNGLPKKELFNRNSFGNFKTFDGLMMSKWVEKRSQILIWGLGWPYIQNENFNWQFSLEKCDFWNVTKNRLIIWHFEAFFTTSKNSRSLPLKSSLIGLNQALKLWIAWQTRNLSASFNCWSVYGMKVELMSNWMKVESRRSKY